MSRPKETTFDDTTVDMTTKRSISEAPRTRFTPRKYSQAAVSPGALQGERLTPVGTPARRRSSEAPQSRATTTTPRKLSMASVKGVRAIIGEIFQTPVDTPARGPSSEAPQSRATTTTPRKLSLASVKPRAIFGEKFQMTIFYITIWICTLVVSYTTETSGNYLSVMKVNMSTFALYLVKSFSIVFTMALIYLGDSFIGTYPLWIVSSILNVTILCLLQLISCIPAIRRANRAMVFVKVVCELVLPMTNVLISILVTLANKSFVIAQNYDVATVAGLISIFFHFTGIVAAQIVDTILFNYRTANLAYFLAFNTLLSVLGTAALVVIRAKMLHNQMFRYKMMNYVACCTYAMLKTRAKSAKWCKKMRPEEETVNYAEKYHYEIQDTTLRFHRIIAIAAFAICICGGFHYIKVMAEKQRAYLLELYYLPLMKHAHVISHGLIVLNIVLSYFVYIPLLFKPFKAEITPLRVHGVGQMIMIMSLFMMYVFIIILGHYGVKLHETTEAQLRVHNCAEKTKLKSKWIADTIEKGSYKNILMIAATKREHGVVQIENSLYNYTKPIYIYSTLSTSYVVAPNGFFRVEGHDPFRFEDIREMTMQQSRIIVFSMLEEQFRYDLWSVEGYHYAAKAPVLGKRQYVFVKPSSVYRVIGVYRKMRMIKDFRIIPKSIYTALIYKANNSTLAMELHLSHTTIKISELWLFIPVFFSSMSLSFLYIAHMHIITTESPVSLLFTIYILSYVFTKIGKLLYTPFTTLLSPSTILVGFIFLNTAVLIYFIRFAMKFDTT